MKGTFPDIIGKQGARLRKRPVEKYSPGVAVPDVVRETSSVQVRKRSFLQVDGHTARTPAGCGEDARDASAMRSTSQRMIGSAISYTKLTALLNPQFKYQNDHVEFRSVFHLWPSLLLNCLTPLGCYAGTHRESEVVSG